MQIQLINVAQKMPAWVDMGCADYAKRLPRELGLKELTLPLAKSASRQSAEQRREMVNQAPSSGPRRRNRGRRRRGRQRRDRGGCCCTTAHEQECRRDCV